MKKTNQKCTPLDPTAVIDNKLRRIRQKREIKHFFVKLFAVSAILFLVFRFVYGIAFVEGEGMYPSLRDGDIGLFFRLERNVMIGDIVTFKVEGQRYFSRVVAVAGDVVDITEEGNLSVNQNIQQEEIFYPTFRQGNRITYPCTVPKGSVYVLSDYRTSAADSREFGAVALEGMDGKVISFIRRRGL